MQTFDVKGMTCQHCIAAVKAAIQIAAPDAAVDVDLATGKVIVHDDVAPQEVIIEAIEAEGYQATAAEPA